MYCLFHLINETIKILNITCLLLVSCVIVFLLYGAATVIVLSVSYVISIFILIVFINVFFW